MNRIIKVLLILNLVVLTGVLLRSSLASRSVAAQASAKDNQELTGLMDEDQADRTPPAGKSIDWKIVTPRDHARLKRVKEIYSQNLLRTGNDYFNAALLLQHSDKSEDYLLAHELCVVAISKKRGVESLAAASEDRFLKSIGRPQRFGSNTSRTGQTNRIDFTPSNRALPIICDV